MMPYKKPTSLFFFAVIALVLASSPFNSNIEPVKAQVQAGTPSTVATITGQPIGFSETSSYVKLNFTMFIIQFDKSSGSSTIYAKNGSILVYYHFMVLQYWNDKVKDWRQAGTFQSLSWIKHDDYHYSVIELFQDSSTTPRTNYTITYDIRSDSRVKISIRIESGASRQYRLVWSFDGIVYSSWREVKNSDNVKCQLCFGNETQPYSFIKFDWQDIYEQFKSDIASYSVTTSARGRKADIYFAVGTVAANDVLTVDPSVVGTSSSGYATAYPFQRKTFYANGRFWAFFLSGGLAYSTSVDGVTWTSTTVIRSASYGYDFSIWFDGIYLHYAYAAGSPIYYRRGIPNSDGTITWSAAEQTVSTTYNTASRPMVSVDSNGYVWIGYTEYDSNIYYYPYVIRSGNNNGTWGTTPTGFPYRLSTTYGVFWIVSVIPLTSGKMLAVYALGDLTVKARKWDGSAWGTEVATTSAIYSYYCYSAVAQGDDVHLVFLKSTGYDILYTKYSYASNSFSAETTLVAGATSTSVPVISIDPSTNDLYVFAATKTTGTPAGWTANHIYYKKYTASSGQWGSWIDWIDESSEQLTYADRLTCFYKAYTYPSGFLVGLEYMTGSTYNVKFAYLGTLPRPPNAPTLNSPAASYRFNPGASVTFSWTFSDNDTGDSQSAYQLQIGNSGFTTIYVDTGKVTSTNTSTTVTLPSNMTVGIYYWRVTTWDSQNTQGAWSAGRAIIVDRIKVNSLTADDTRRDVDSTVTLSVQLVYEYDGGYITSGTFTLNGLTLSYSGSNGVWTATDSKGSVQAIIYNSVAGTEGTYGLTTVNMNNQAVTVIWDKVQFTLTVTNDRINVGTTPQISVSGKYAYDNSAFQGSYLLNDTLTKTTVGKWAFKVSSMTDNAYGLTAFDSNVVEIIWDGLKISQYVVDLMNQKIYVKAEYAYDGQPIANGNVSYAGLYALTNSTGWAVFDVSQLANVVWDSESYCVSEPNGVTYKVQNQTISFHKVAVSPFNLRGDHQIANCSWNGAEKKLSFVTKGTCVVHVGDYGQPNHVEVNGEIYTDWSYDNAKQEVIIRNLASNVVLVWTTAEGGIGGAPVIPFVPLIPQPSPIVPVPQPIQPSPLPAVSFINQNAIYLLVGGIAFLVIVSSVKRGREEEMSWIEKHYKNERKKEKKWWKQRR
jgi:hypothetical protein